MSAIADPIIEAVLTAASEYLYAQDEYSAAEARADLTDALHQAGIDAPAPDTSFDEDDPF